MHLTRVLQGAGSIRGGSAAVGSAERRALQRLDESGDPAESASFQPQIAIVSLAHEGEPVFGSGGAQAESRVRTARCNGRRDMGEFLGPVAVDSDESMPPSMMS